MYSDERGIIKNQNRFTRSDINSLTSTSEEFIQIKKPKIPRLIIILSCLGSVLKDQSSVIGQLV